MRKSAVSVCVANSPAVDAADGAYKVVNTTIRISKTASKLSNPTTTGNDKRLRLFTYDDLLN